MLMMYLHLFYSWFNFKNVSTLLQNTRKIREKTFDLAFINFLNCLNEWKEKHFRMQMKRNMEYNGFVCESEFKTKLVMISIF